MVNLFINGVHTPTLLMWKYLPRIVSKIHCSLRLNWRFFGKYGAVYSLLWTKFYFSHFCLSWKSFRLGKWNFQGWIYMLRYVLGRYFEVPTSTHPPLYIMVNYCTLLAVFNSYFILYYYHKYKSLLTLHNFCF